MKESFTKESFSSISMKYYQSIDSEQFFLILYYLIFFILSSLDFNFQDI